MQYQTEFQSAPERLLDKVGTDQTFDLLCQAAQSLTSSELMDLEEDLRFYAETRLIGIHMSRLMKLLKRRAALTMHQVSRPVLPRAS